MGSSICCLTEWISPAAKKKTLCDWFLCGSGICCDSIRVTWVRIFTSKFMSFWGRMRVFVLVSLPVWLPLWHPWVLFFDRIFPFDLKISCYPAGWLLTLGFTSPKIQLVWLLACAMGIWIKRLRKRNDHRTLFWKSIIMGIFKKKPTDLGWWSSPIWKQHTSPYDH